MNLRTPLSALLVIGLSGACLAKEPDAATEVRNLSSPDKAEASIERLKKLGAPAVKHLVGEAIEGSDLAARGWAIVALGEIGGDAVTKRLDEIHANAKLPVLVRTWAAAARVKLAKNAAEVSRLVSLASTFPAVSRPLAQRLVALSQDDPDAMGTLLTLNQRYPQLQPALKKAITSRGTAALVKALVSGKDNNVRRMAASYLGLMAARGDASVAEQVTAGYTFDPKAQVESWKGGALFLPGIRWNKKSARALVAQLMRWVLWADRHNRADLLQQLNNNMRSIGLAHVAGYQPSGGGAVGWLRSWRAVVGRAGIEDILTQQGVQNVPKYQAALR
jgi:hypothetical protein